VALQQCYGLRGSITALSELKSFAQIDVKSGISKNKVTYCSWLDLQYGTNHIVMNSWKEIYEVNIRRMVGTRNFDLKMCSDCLVANGCRMPNWMLNNKMGVRQLD
jgi:hypothetical protein